MHKYMKNKRNFPPRDELDQLSKSLKLFQSESLIKFDFESLSYDHKKKFEPLYIFSGSKINFMSNKLKAKKEKKNRTKLENVVCKDI